MSYRPFLFALAVTLTVGGVAYAQHKGAPNAGKASPEHKHGGPESEHTLRTVMQHLALAEAEIQTGILMNNRLMIANGAKAIAHHPNPKGGIRPYIKKNHKALKGTIMAMDKIVHGTSVEIFKKSKTAPMLELAQLNADMVKGCVSCHNVFRD